MNESFIGIEIDSALLDFFRRYAYALKILVFFKTAIFAWKQKISCQHCNFLQTYGIKNHDCSNWSSIPLLRNHAFFMKFSRRLLCWNGLAKYATKNDTPGTDFSIIYQFSIIGPPNDPKIFKTKHASSTWLRHGRPKNHGTPRKSRPTFSDNNLLQAGFKIRPRTHVLHEWPKMSSFTLPFLEIPQPPTKVH